MTLRKPVSWAKQSSSKIDHLLQLKEFEGCLTMWSFSNDRHDSLHLDWTIWVRTALMSFLANWQILLAVILSNRKPTQFLGILVKAANNNCIHCHAESASKNACIVSLLAEKENTSGL